MAAAEDEVRGRRQSSSASHFPAFFSVRTTTPFSPRLRPRKEAPLACRSRLMSKSCVAMVIDDADGSFFGGRARSYRGRGASPVEGNEFFLSSRQISHPQLQELPHRWPNSIL